MGVTLSGALTPTGLGVGAIVPLIEAGFIDWIVSTGANLYHDIHRSLGLELLGSTPFVDDIALRDRKLIRIYDILFDQDVLYKTDDYLAATIHAPEFQRHMGTAEMHHHLGRTCASGSGCSASRTSRCSARPMRPACPSTPPAPATQHRHERRRPASARQRPAH